MTDQKPSERVNLDTLASTMQRNANELRDALVRGQKMAGRDDTLLSTVVLVAQLAKQVTEQHATIAALTKRVDELESRQTRYEPWKF